MVGTGLRGDMWHCVASAPRKGCPVPNAASTGRLACRGSVVGGGDRCFNHGQLFIRIILFEPLYLAFRGIRSGPMLCVTPSEEAAEDTGVVSTGQYLKMEFYIMWRVLTRRGVLS